MEQPKPQVEQKVRFVDENGAIHEAVITAVPSVLGGEGVDLATLGPLNQRVGLAVKFNATGGLWTYR